MTPTSISAAARPRRCSTLPPGQHTLQLDFGDLKHEQLDPPMLSKKITVTVK